MMKSFNKSPPESPQYPLCPVLNPRLRSVFEGSTAAGSTYEIFEQVPVNLPESSGLGHLSQVIHTELKAELFQVLNDKRKGTN